MSHPENRRERFLIGKKLGEKRGYGYWGGFYSVRDEARRKEDLRVASYKRRDTTKLCSCEMCGNPRKWSKDKLTMQEKKAMERDGKELFDAGCRNI